MKSIDDVQSMSLAELSADQTGQISGGESTVKYTDSHGYTWEYYYDDGGNMTGFCVVRIMTVR